MLVFSYFLFLRVFLSLIIPLLARIVQFIDIFNVLFCITDTDINGFMTSHICPFYILNLAKIKK